MSSRAHQIGDILIVLLLTAAICVDIARARRRSIERERRIHLRHSATFDFCSAVAYLPKQETRDEIITAWTGDQRELALARLAEEVSAHRIRTSAAISAREVEKEVRAGIRAHHDAGKGND